MAEARGGVRLEARDLVFRYEDGTPALAGLSLVIQPGEFVALVGQNGSGKTTLAKHFNGLLRPTAGTVLVDGQETSALSVGALARKVGYVFQNPDHQVFSPTTREEIAFGPRNLGLPETEVTARVEVALARFGLEPYADHPPAALSHGLRRKVALAAVVAMETPGLVLDEPTAGLDGRDSQALMALLRELRERGRTIVLITHDMRLVAEHAERVLVLDGGRLLADGAPEAVFHDEALLQRAHLEPPAVTRLSRALAARGRIPDALVRVGTLCDRLAEVLTERAR